MPHLNVVPYSGISRSIHVDEGTTLMEAIRANGFDELLALCGGVCSCATCHVYVDGVDPDLLSPMSDDERDLLDGTGRRLPNSRLSCQVRITAALEGVTATIAPEGVDG